MNYFCNIIAKFQIFYSELNYKSTGVENWTCVSYISSLNKHFSIIDVHFFIPLSNSNESVLTQFLQKIPQAFKSSKDSPQFIYSFPSFTSNSTCECAPAICKHKANRDVIHFLPLRHSPFAFMSSCCIHENLIKSVFCWLSRISFHSFNPQVAVLSAEEMTTHDSQIRSWKSPARNFMVRNGTFCKIIDRELATHSSSSFTPITA